MCNICYEGSEIPSHACINLFNNGKLNASNENRWIVLYWINEICLKIIKIIDNNHISLNSQYGNLQQQRNIIWVFFLLLCDLRDTEYFRSRKNNSCFIVYVYEKVLDVFALIIHAQFAFSICTVIRCYTLHYTHVTHIN